LSPERTAAIHHAIAKVPPSTEVPVGLHDLSDVHVVIRFPHGAALERGAGNMGGGCDEVAIPAAKVPSAGALLRLIDACLKHHTPDQQANLWRMAIRLDLTSGEEAIYPKLSLCALTSIQEELGTFKTMIRKSATKAVGLKTATIECYESDEFHLLEQRALTRFLDREVADERQVMSAIG
jgi:hypothetical protein